MSEIDVADDRLKILLAQLDGAWELLDSRLCDRPMFMSAEGSSEPTLTDDEFFWQPVPGCWSLRRREDGASSAPIGAGDWVLDNDRPLPDPPPVTTIAWRMCHICVSPLQRYDYTFGTHSLTMQDVTWPGNARDAVAFLRETHRKWRSALETLSAAELVQIGRCDNPYGLDQQVRFIDLLAWCNTEFTHHAAEIACLRDLYRAQHA